MSMESPFYCCNAIFLLKKDYVNDYLRTLSLYAFKKNV